MTATGNAKLPYGNLPRLLMAWVSTEAVRTQRRELILGRSLSEFMRKLDITRGAYISDLTSAHSSGATLGLLAHVSAPRARTPALRMFRAALWSLSILRSQAEQQYVSLLPGRFRAPQR